jgi:hypothetical protein
MRTETRQRCRQRCVHCRADHPVLVGRCCLIKTWLRRCGCRSLICFAIGLRNSSDRMQARLTGATRGPAHPTSRGRSCRARDGKRSEMLPHNVLAQVPDVLHSLVNLSDVSLVHSRVTSFRAGVEPTLFKVNCHTMPADVDGELLKALTQVKSLDLSHKPTDAHARAATRPALPLGRRGPTRSWTRQAGRNASPRTTRCRACST